jgi:hypothetical protein
MPDKLYLKPPELVKHSAHHTAYVGDDSGADKKTPGGDTTLHRLEFHNGVARNVPDELARRFEAVGVASRTKPRLPEED